MLQVTQSARDAVKEYMSENKLDSAIRVFQNQGSCCGPQLAIMVDDPRAGDTEVEFDGQVYVMDKGLDLLTGGITLDFIDEDGRKGFTITTERPMEAGSCGCGDSSCGSGGCC